MKSLLIHLRKTGGRNSQGRITLRHRGGGRRRLYRLIDFGQEHFGVQGTVQTIEYDPNRNAFIALVLYQDGKRGYILASEGLASGSTVLCKDQTEVQPSNRMQLQYIPIGTMVHNIELQEGRGGKIVRGAGTGAMVVAHEGAFTHVQLPSSEIRKIPKLCYASIGVLSNAEHKYQILRKAGRVRLKGRRPKVRGTAMNPIDHPHGHGGGRSMRGMKAPKTKWGKPFLGIKTRKRKWSDKLIIQRRIKKK